jgi:hypothetical protein
VNQNESLGAASSPLACLESYQKTSSLVREEAELYLQTTRDDRKSWRKI